MPNDRLGHRIIALFRAVLTVVIVTAATLELAVRFIVDDGMQFDLEMWKYARDVKVISDNPIIGHEHGSNRRATLMGVDLRTNSRGFRDREFALEPTPGTLRIMMLGDSLTEGWGVRLEQTFSKRIERLYEAQGIKAEVINAGVGNWNTVQEVEFFLTKAHEYHPHIVVLNFFVNDAEPNPKSSVPSFFARHCYSCVFLLGRVDTIVRQISNRGDWSDYYLRLYADGTSATWLAARNAITRLADYCKAHGIRLLVASLPELHDVRHYRFGRVTDLVRAATTENRAAFVDLLPYLSNQESAALWVTPPDPHPNGFANQFIAVGLFESLRSIGGPGTQSEPHKTQE